MKILKFGCVTKFIATWGPRVKPLSFNRIRVATWQILRKPKQALFLATHESSSYRKALISAISWEIFDFCNKFCLVFIPFYYSLQEICISIQWFGNIFHRAFFMITNNFLYYYTIHSDFNTLSCETLIYNKRKIKSSLMNLSLSCY